MKAFVLGLALAAGSSYAFAACEQPSMVMIPDGATATRDALLAAQTNVKNYMAEMAIYLSCVNEELATAGDDAPTEFRTLLVGRHSAAESEMDQVAIAFNREVQAYLAAHPEEPAPGSASR